MDMPQTKIFFGQRSSSTSYGSISIDGNGSSARITFEDKDTRQETSAILQVYELHLLKSLQIFKKNPCEKQVEKLINTWYTIKTDGVIIKFATQNELAFAFSAENVEDCFSKWNGIHAGELNYFEEIQFIKRFTIEQLDSILGMDAERIKLLVKNQVSFVTLLHCGITIEQIGKLELSVLKKYLSSSFKLPDALTLVTIQQILGLEHTPPAIPEASSGQKLHYLGGSDSGSAGGFSYKFNDNKIIVTHTSNQTTLTVTFGTLTETGKTEFSLIDFSTCNSEHLVHDWYHISDTAATSDNPAKAMYCPELGYVINETSQGPFPVQHFKENCPHMLHEILYYREKSFIIFLEEYGITLGELRELPGMTQPKIDELFKHRFILFSLLKTGIQFADLAKVEQDRLSCVLSNYAKTEAALEFTNVFEVLGLGEAPSTYSPAFFSQAPAPEPRGFSCRQNISCQLL